MKLTREQVIHIATLARIKLSEEEISKFRQQLSDLLANFDEALQRIDANVDPLVLNELAGVWREDEVKPSYTPELTGTDHTPSTQHAQRGCYFIRRTH
jgi:aspartyl-tRNA(Asn)/glutamyl-tRNA(Gln) amidotransferase subunit C